jgi:hypothetical protein
MDWDVGSGHDSDQLDERSIERFLDQRSQHWQINAGDRAALRRLLSAVRDKGLIAAAPSIKLTEQQQIVEEFSAYIINDRGLSDSASSSATWTGTYTKKPLSQRYHRFPDGTRVGRDLYSAFLARFVLDNRLDAIQAAKVWTGAGAFLRAASNGFEPASGKGLALRHATLGVRAGRSKKFHADHREAGDGVALAVLPVSRAPESGEAPWRSLWPRG